MAHPPLTPGGAADLVTEAVTLTREAESSEDKQQNLRFRSWLKAPLAV
jgi:hypothetical protein